jgi:hypothetical protein
MTPKTVEQIDGLLAELSPMYTIASQGSARLVAGPTGVFVLVFGGEDVSRRPNWPRLALTTRATLADHLSWVPSSTPWSSRPTTGAIRTATT